MKVNLAIADQMFLRLCAAVKAKERPPVVKGIQQAAYAELAKQGRIKVEISGHNWRRVTILVGKHTGRKTPPNPDRHKVYAVVDTKGFRRLPGAEQYSDEDEYK